MGFSFGTFLTNMVFSNLMLCVCAYFLRRQKSVDQWMVKIILACIILSMFRMMVPIEFFFSHTIGIPVLLPYVHSMLTIPLFHGYINLRELLFIIWFAGALVKGWRILYKYRNLRKILMSLPEVRSEEISRILSEMDLERKNIRIVKLDGAFPCITGFLHPVILLPDMNLKEGEMSYILRHELFHYMHHDLWFKTAGEMLGIVYWWNPVVIILNRQINFMTEIKDDMALTMHMDERQKVEYSQCLVRIAKETESEKAEFSLGLVENDAGLLEKRIAFIFDSHGKNKKNGIAVALLIWALVSNWLIFEPKYPIPLDCQPCINLEDYGAFYENGQVFIIVDGKKEVMEIEAEYFSFYCNEEEAALYENK